MRIIITDKSNQYHGCQGKILKENADGKFLAEVYYYTWLKYDVKQEKIELELSRGSFVYLETCQDKIPKGPYCYFGSRAPGDKNYKPCPYWGMDETKPDQSCGFCKLTNTKDWEDDTLLWDQVKDCGIKYSRDDD